MSSSFDRESTAGVFSVLDKEDARAIAKQPMDEMGIMRKEKTVNAGPGKDESRFEVRFMNGTTRPVRAGFLKQTRRTG